MNRGQYQSEIKEEERSAIENVRDEEAEIINKSFAKADNKVLIKLPSKFCKEIKKYLQSGMDQLIADGELDEDGVQPGYRPAQRQDRDEPARRERAVHRARGDRE